MVCSLEWLTPRRKRSGARKTSAVSVYFEIYIKKT